MGKGCDYFIMRSLTSHPQVRGCYPKCQPRYAHNMIELVDSRLFYLEYSCGLSKLVKQKHHSLCSERLSIVVVSNMVIVNDSLRILNLKKVKLETSSTIIEKTRNIIYRVCTISKEFLQKVKLRGSSEEVMLRTQQCKFCSMANCKLNKYALVKSLMNTKSN